MLINLSNHPSTGWKDTQTNAALAQYGNIYDIPFPSMSPTATPKQIQQIAQTYLQEIIILAKNKSNQPFAVHIMGEMTFTYYVVRELKQANIKCIASAANRNAIEKEDGSKIVLFDFVQFREYT